MMLTYHVSHFSDAAKHADKVTHSMLLSHAGLAVHMWYVGHDCKSGDAGGLLSYTIQLIVHGAGFGVVVCLP
jgi:hypothetical protein